MSSVDEKIAAWAVSLPQWEQIALSWILHGRELDDSDVQVLLQHLLQEHELAEKELETEAPTFSPTAATPSNAGPLLLIAVYDLENVNALVSEQRLEFSEGATAIFGANGAGKSGYARLLGCVGFTRGDQEILPNAATSDDLDAPRSAKIDFLRAGNAETMCLDFNKPLLQFPSVHVFDSTSVHVHLTASNQLSFAPLALTCLTKLAAATDRVRDALSQKISSIETKPNHFPFLFEGESRVRSLIDTLDESTDMDVVRQLAVFGNEEDASLRDLELQVAKAKATSVIEQKKTLMKDSTSIKTLIDDAKGAAQSLSHAAIESVSSAISALVTARDAVAAMSVSKFEVEGLSQVGSPQWQSFIRAARALAIAEAEQGVEYPEIGQPCLLCNRPLDGKARTHLLEVWAYLEAEAQSKLADAQGQLELVRKALERIDTTVLDEGSLAYEVLSRLGKDLIKPLGTFQEGLESVREALLAKIAMLDQSQVVNPPLLDPCEALEALQSQLLGKLKVLDAEPVEQKTQALDAQRRELDHRKRLSGVAAEVAQFVHERRWAASAKKIGGSTAHITKQYNQLFTELVTEKYVQRFRALLKELGRPMKVDVKTFGTKASVKKRIVLTAEAGAEWAATDKILSEGEKRAVALADFLAEVNTDVSSSTVVLDDPVTSLDLEWRERTAAVLAHQAKEVQLIVLTHDLPFLYYFTHRCEEEGVELRTHWVKRGETDDLPGYVFLDNSPSAEKDYKTPARALDLWQRAREAPPESQERILRDGFGALRTTYEAFIVFDLFGGVIERFKERISFGRLENLVWDKTIIADIIHRCETLSRHIEGHLHSDSMTAKKPTPDDLKSEIDMFIALRKRLAAMKKESG